jgi:phospholipid/cholesterol/gamma-HCH transport system substrate-binding protein
MPENVGCTEPITKSNPRGTQNLPRVAPGVQGYDIGVRVDDQTGELTWGVTARAEEATPVRGNVAPPSLGEDSWKWLYLQPLLDPTR